MRNSLVGEQAEQATAASSVGTYGVSGSGLSANHGNYIFTQAAGNSTALTIDPATLTYTATSANQTYGSSNSSFAGSVTGLVNGQTLASQTAGSAVLASYTHVTSNGGTYGNMGASFGNALWHDQQLSYQFSASDNFFSGNGAVYAFHPIGQTSSGNLLYTEKLHAGGPEILRGYDPNSIAGDRGIRSTRGPD